MGFIQDFTGSSARKDLKRAKQASTAALTSGYNEGNAYYDKAYDELTPYAQSGLAGQTAYTDALGLGTAEGRTAAQDRYFNDPAFSAVTEDRSNALLRNINARGGGNGVKSLGAARVGLQGYNDYLNRLQGLGAQGGQFATGQSAIRAGQGDLRYGFGASLAGNEINAGNALAQSRGILSNNLLGLAGTAAKFFTGGVAK